MSEGPRLDLHVHSRHSPDGRSTVREIAARIAAEGLDGFALTDHNTVAGHAELADIGARFPRLRVLPGVEVSTVEGHLLAYGVRDCPPVHRPVVETIDWIRARGGEPVLAHPFRWMHGVGRRVATTAGVAAIEAVNGHNSARANARARAVVLARSIGSTGGSDAHTLREVGRVATRFPPGCSSEDGFLVALRNGTTTPEGRPLSATERFRVNLRSAVLRLGRGFRPI